MATALLLPRVVKAMLNDLMNLVVHVRPELDGAADSLMVAAIIGKNLLGVKDLIKKYKTANTMENLFNVCKDAFLKMLGGNKDNLKNVLTFSATRCDFIDFDNLELEDFELASWVLNYIDMVIVFGNTHQGTEGEAELHIGAFLTSFNTFFSDAGVEWNMMDLQAFLTSDTAMSDNLLLSLYIGQQVALFTGGPLPDTPPIGTFLDDVRSTHLDGDRFTHPGWAIAEMAATAMAATAIPVLSASVWMGGFSLDGGLQFGWGLQFELQVPPSQRGGVITQAGSCVPSVLGAVPMPCAVCHGGVPAVWDTCNPRTIRTYGSIRAYGWHEL